MATPVDNKIPLTGNPFVDGLAQGSGWNFADGSRLITYSFSLYIIAYDRSWRDDMKPRVAAAFGEWANVANITFAESGSNTLFYESTADIALTPTQDDELDAGPGIVALGIFPSPALADVLLAEAEATRADYPRPEGDIFFDHLHPVFDSPYAGSTGFAILLHEIGHALGLKHTFDDGGNGRPTFEQLGIQGYAAERYTVMSMGSNLAVHYGHASTPMPLDILAIQRIYGANMSYRTGNDEYSTHTVNTNGGRYMRTIWDAGGFDTIAASGGVGGVTIDVRPGAIMDFGEGTVLGIAYDTIIERVVGGADNDNLIGNDADNEFHGNGGSDRLEGGRGNDTYYTHTGNTIVELANEGIDLVHAGNTGFVLPANVEDLVLAWGVAAGTGNELANRLAGNPFQNTLRGMAGDDYIDGGDHADVLIGGPGNDTYVVETNLVRADGVLVVDSVVENAGEGHDTILSSVTFWLPSNVEDLVLNGTGNFSASGNALDNVLTDNPGVNSLYGLEGADTLMASGGFDLLDGGLGSDTANFSRFGAAIWVKLTHTPGEVATRDSSALSAGAWRNLADLVDIEHVTGTAFADELHGHGGANRLAGGLGDDFFGISGGLDVFDGGGGSDTVDFSTFGAAIWAKLTHTPMEVQTRDTSNLQAGAWRDLADLVDVENVIGTAYWDELHGNAGDNIFGYTGGRDVLNGAGGMDTADFSRFGAAIWVKLTHTPMEAATRGTSNLQVGPWHDIADLVDVENVTGSVYADEIHGNHLANVLGYTGGLDLLDGAGGVDTADFSPFGAAVWVNLTHTPMEAATRDSTNLSSGMWRDIANLVDVENVTGSAYADEIHGNHLGNEIAGGAGKDLLRGNGGPDWFLFKSIHDGLDTITDFTRGAGNDSLRIGDLLAGQSVNAGNIGNYVQLTESGGSTILAVDVDGTAGGAGMVGIALLQGHTGLALNDMLAQGNLAIT